MLAKRKQTHTDTLAKLVFWFVFGTLGLSLIYAIVNIVTAPSGGIPTQEYDKVKGDYVIMLAQCVIGIVVILLPSIIERQFKIHIPSFMTLVFIIFLYASVYLGEIRNFYYKIHHWDNVLHVISGLMLGALGFSVVHLLNHTEKISLNPLFVAIFAFCFAVSLGVIWEIYEYGMDVFAGTNMQKFSDVHRIDFVGRAALNDTMQDMVVDTFGAAVMAIIGFVSLKYKKGWVEKLLLEGPEESDQHE